MNGDEVSDLGGVVGRFAIIDIVRREHPFLDFDWMTRSLLNPIRLLLAGPSLLVCGFDLRPVDFLCSRSPFGIPDQCEPLFLLDLLVSFRLVFSSLFQGDLPMRAHIINENRKTYRMIEQLAI
jgi:hypothetical protein